MTVIHLYSALLATMAKLYLRTTLVVATTLSPAALKDDNVALRAQEMNTDTIAVSRRALMISKKNA